MIIPTMDPKKRLHFKPLGFEVEKQWDTLLATRIMECFPKGANFASLARISSTRS
jgi:hypothetical protein